MQKIAIFASGTGSNAEKLMAHFQNHPKVSIALIASNKSNAKVLDWADSYKIPKLIFNSAALKNGAVLQQLQDRKIDYIVLAGFLSLVPLSIIKQFADKIVNIHPSLLPKYGGKGMYGHFVHEAVAANKETISGITIHLVNEEFDKGKILFQAATRINSEDDTQSIQKKVQVLEHQYFAGVVESVLFS